MITINYITIIRLVVQVIDEHISYSYIDTKGSFSYDLD